MAASSMASKLLAEFVGTFFLITTVVYAVLAGKPDYAGFAIGSVLFIVIMGLGGISGANFNPAVSVTLGITKSMGGPGMEWKDVVMYCIAQVTAGLAAVLNSTHMLGSVINVAPAEGFSLPQAGACETLYTFMLCFVVLNVAAARKNAEEKNQYFGLAIGFCVVAGAYGAGAVSGGCFNPAVALGLSTSSYKLGFGKSLAYAGFELLGAAMAALLFSLVRPEDFGREKGDARKLLSEFLGTFILVLTVGLNILAKSNAAALSIAASLAAMIFALGDVSGAHFNPAVTCAIFCSGRDLDLTIVQVCFYTAMQILGGVAASLTCAQIYDVWSEGPIEPYTLIQLNPWHRGRLFMKVGPIEPYTLMQALEAEAFFTFLLAFTVLCVAVSKLTKASQYFGLVIGFCIVVGGFGVGAISGAALNPAVALGLASVGGGIKDAAAYSGVELLAGATAAAVFLLTHNVELEGPEAKSLFQEAEIWEQESQDAKV